MSTTHQVFIALGSNLGDRQAHYRHAVKHLAALPTTTIVAQSSRYETQPLGEARNWYLNGVIEIRTELVAGALLDRLQAIERALGRVRSAEHWTSRTLDLDILFFDDKRINTPQLHIPHPELHKRRFVLKPLCEIAPDFYHPHLRRTVAELLAELDDEKRVIKLPAHSHSPPSHRSACQAASLTKAVSTRPAHSRNNSARS